MSDNLNNKGRNNLLPIARDVIKHAKAGTMRQAKDVMRLPASNYTDNNRFAAELEKVIKRVPIILGPSCEIPNPGDFKTINVAETSLILSRDKSGKANALINVCSHRGACLTKKEKGNSNRFTCPYHGWNFSNSGELIAISSEDDFGKIDKNNY